MNNKIKRYALINKNEPDKHLFVRAETCGVQETDYGYIFTAGSHTAPLVYPFYIPDFLSKKQQYCWKEVGSVNR